MLDRRNLDSNLYAHSYIPVYGRLKPENGPIDQDYVCNHGLYSAMSETSGQSTTEVIPLQLASANRSWLKYRGLGAEMAGKCSVPAATTILDTWS